jgi:hypothetical protein
MLGITIHTSIPIDRKRILLMTIGYKQIKTLGWNLTTQMSLIMNLKILNKIALEIQMMINQILQDLVLFSDLILMEKVLIC